MPNLQDENQSNPNVENSEDPFNSVVLPEKPKDVESDSKPSESSQIQEIKEIDEKGLETNLNKIQSLLKKDFPENLEIKKAIEDIHKSCETTQNDPEETWQVFKSLSDIADEIERCEEGFFNVKAALEETLKKGNRTLEIIKALNIVYAKSQQDYIKGSERDINNDEVARKIYVDILKTLETLNNDFGAQSKKLDEFFRGYTESCKEIERIVNVEVASIRQFGDAFDRNEIIISSGEGKEREFIYKGLSRTEEEKEQTLGRKTVLLKYPVILSCLRAQDGVEVEIEGIDKSDEFIPLQIDMEGYRGIRFKYNNNEYIALVANKYGNAMYFLPLSKFNLNQYRLTKTLLKELKAMRRYWKITDDDTNNFNTIINKNLENIQNIYNDKDVGDSLSSKLDFLLKNKGVEKVVREIAKSFSGSIKGVLQELNEANS